MKQLHKRFTKEEVVEVFERYLSGEIGIKQSKALLGVGKSRFFTLLKVYRESPNDFSLEYQRKCSPRQIDKNWEEKIVCELQKEAAIIQDKANPVRRYNYSYVRGILETKHKVCVSLPTIISRAKKGFYHEKRVRKSHDREVLTNYIGELAQHDTSYHLWSPLAGIKWYLVTTIDDHSRMILYGDLWEKETSWVHIVAAKTVVTSFGCPLKYYVDNHSIFRFVERRDTVWQKSHFGEEAVVQWREVLRDLNIEVIYALSPAAKGKVERPYQWLQDHLVRTCVREGITMISQAREVLHEELYRYNNHRVHSTTKEIPIVRYEKALKERRSLFRKLVIRKPYESMDDIFCYRIKRIVDSYRKVSWNALKFSLSGVSPHDEVELRISFDLKSRIANIRFWCRERLVGEYPVKADDLKKSSFKL